MNLLFNFLAQLGISFVIAEVYVMKIFLGQLFRTDPTLVAHLDEEHSQSPNISFLTQHKFIFHVKINQVFRAYVIRRSNGECAFCDCA